MLHLSGKLRGGAIVGGDAVLWTPHVSSRGDVPARTVFDCKALVHSRLVVIVLAWRYGNILLFLVDFVANFFLVFIVEFFPIVF